MMSERSSPKVRLTIPFWGQAFAQKVVRFTIPALVAPGNLPVLAQDFDVEISLVTQTELFDFIKSTPSYTRLCQIAQVSLIPVDDLLTGFPGDYGPVLTFAMIRGYEDLGERMLNYYLMFLNADFILADGSYRTAARLMKEGRGLIHSPSFRCVLEDILVDLEPLVENEGSVLALPPRQMVDLALRHKHVTVKARTVNQKTTHQWRMDQFYWYIDETALICHQWSIGLIALKPERVVLNPILMFDYGFIPDICPTTEPYFITDSDDFFMIEPQKRVSGDDLVRLGWIEPDAVAADLSRWTTEHHHKCGRQMHVIHSADLPENTSEIIAESRAYIDDLFQRVGPPNPHINHPLFCSWWQSVCERIEGRYIENVNIPRLRHGAKKLLAW